MNRSSRKRRTSQVRGFTFAELVIVVLVLSIMAAVAVPKYSDSMDQYRVEAAALRITADLALARKHAQATSASQTVQFTVSTDKYVLVGMDDPDHSTDEYEIDLSRTGYPAELTLVDLVGGDSVTFDQYGKPDVGGSVTVVAGDEERTVTIDATTGKASVN
ncbi:MAG: prepilin-type N-terminal cleavage/methylation domain-containing protein [Planctomycetes bacterium]|nr:prepilin-type N-terminal cleavage/methylation domain-containing protein [Planctomycetota bacterium]